MSVHGSMELPLCPICCEWLGKYGGPVTLPCGHNGCLDCFSHVQSYNPECPLCRKAFDAGLVLSCNHELRDLIAVRQRAYCDDEDADRGWEAFPGPKLANEHYALSMLAEQRQQQQQQQRQQQQQQQQPSLSFDSCYGPSSSSRHAYPAVPQPASAPNVNSSSSSSGAGGRGGINPGVLAGAAVLQQQQEGGAGGGPQGLGALVSSSSSSRAAGLQQYHASYHQHPGLPLSAPSGTQSDILMWEPPQWLPDSYAPSCCGCHQPFKALTRLRHHCRLCGKVFCNACSSNRKMMPPRFRTRDPQRVCELCAQLLDPLQAFLIGTGAACVAPPVHDALDAVSLRSWLNSPWGTCMADEVYKAANIVHAFSQALRPELERQLPSSLLRGVRGLALLSVMRVGAGWSCTAGTGLVVVRQRNGTWSAPCAISCCGVGWGLSLGGQLTDVLLVLRTEEAVRAFAAGKTLGLGGSASLALGPVGRSAEASVRVGGLAAKGAVLGYSCSKGAYAGVSLEGTVTNCREAVNRAFYGYAVTPRQLLVDCCVPQPPAAALLYQKLDSLTALWENRGSLVQAESSASAAAAAAALPAAASCKGAAAADCKALGSKQQQQQQSRAAAGSTAGSSSSSREWDMVGRFAAADALDQFEDPPPHSLPSPQPWSAHHLQQQQHQQQQESEDFEDEDIDAFLASAPPAPTHLLTDYQPSSSSSQQQQQQVLAAVNEEEDEETMYALEW